MSATLTMDAFVRAPAAVWRVYKYLADRPGPHNRDRIMHWTGFPDPRSQPVIAYVEFANTVDRLNRRLKKHQQRVVGGIETGENYYLEAVG